MVVLSTASPYKFFTSVLQALGGEQAADEFDQMKELHARSGMDIPVRLAGLRTQPIRHEGICEQDGMRASVLAFIQKSL